MQKVTLRGLDAVAFAALHKFEAVKVDGQVEVLVEVGRVMLYNVPERISCEAEFHPHCWHPTYIDTLDRSARASRSMTNCPRTDRIYPSREEYETQAELARRELAMWDEGTKRLMAAGWKACDDDLGFWVSPSGGDSILRAAALKTLGPPPEVYPWVVAGLG